MSKGEEVEPLSLLLRKSQLPLGRGAKPPHPPSVRTGHLPLKGKALGWGNDSAPVGACIGRPPVEMMQYRGRAMLAPTVLICDVPKGSL